MDEVAADGAVASNPKEIGENCDVVIIMLPLAQFRKIIYNESERRDFHAGQSDEITGTSGIYGLLLSCLELETGPFFQCDPERLPP